MDKFTEHLVSTAQQALEKAVAVVGPGVPLKAIGAVIKYVHEDCP